MTNPIALSIALGLSLVLSGPTSAEEQKAAPKKEAAATVDPAVAEIDKFIAEQKIDKTKPGWKTSLPKPPKITAFTKGKKYVWVLATNKGTIKITLKPDAAPMHVSSTIYLTELGFYDGLTFHRVIPKFMAQGGDPVGVGSGGPGYRYDGELVADVKHDKRGILSMAHAGPGTDGSQFFITFGPTPHLDGKHTVFGEVTGGLDVLDKLEAAGSGSGQPSEKLEITKATIVVE